eukprot:1828954-Pleurochrysis_carterae.AAC.2
MGRRVEGREEERERQKTTGDSRRGVSRNEKFGRAKCRKKSGKKELRLARGRKSRGEGDRQREREEGAHISYLRLVVCVRLLEGADLTRVSHRQGHQR